MVAAPVESACDWLTMAQAVEALFGWSYQTLRSNIKSLEARGCPMARRSHVIRHAKYVFMNGGLKWNRSSYYVGIKGAARDSGLEDVNVHTFRHTFASWLAQAGTPDAIRKRLGCWSLGTSADTSYPHFDVELLRPFSEKLDRYLTSVPPDAQAIDLKSIATEKRI